MQPEDLPPPIFIAHQPALQRLANALLREAQIAVDTESNSLFAYRERVCLIQFSILQGDFIVDPLALEDLSPLAPVFSNPKYEKIFHAAEYDLICLKRDFGFEFGNIFDTMVASRILGREECGLGSNLQEQFQVQLDKRLQRANWGQRPLPANLLSYARLDTHYLIALRDRLYGELEQSGRLPLAEEDFRRMCQANGRKDDNGPQDWWRINGAHDLPAKNAAVLMELCRYRENEARAADRPLFKVIGDKTLVAIAAQVAWAGKTFFANVSTDAICTVNGTEVLVVPGSYRKTHPVPAQMSRPWCSHWNSTSRIITIGRQFQDRKLFRASTNSSPCCPRENGTMSLCRTTLVSAVW